MPQVTAPSSGPFPATSGENSPSRDLAPKFDSPPPNFCRTAECWAGSPRLVAAPGPLPSCEGVAERKRPFVRLLRAQRSVGRCAAA